LSKALKRSRKIALKPARRILSDTTPGGFLMLRAVSCGI
jgi:hypothetical protein